MSLNPKYVPYTLLWDKMPIDLSFIYDNEKPAGKHGFLKVRGEKFIFEDGTEARFWGTNFNSGANFPSHEHSEKVAKRLAQIGINMVRLHQLDAEWSTPNIFQFNKGRHLKNTLTLDPESMDRLDYLIYCLKREGIYIYMDFLTYRKFKSGDGVVNAELLKDAARPYSNYNQRLIDLQKSFNQDFMLHINPYTGLAYIDDAVIAMAEVTNENDIFSTEFPIDVEPYRTELEDMYRDFAKDKSIELGPEKIDFNKRTDKLMIEFLCKVQTDYYKEMINHLRKIGAKFPITGTNWGRNNALTLCNTITDFSDAHIYWWVGDQRKFKNEPMIKETVNIIAMASFNNVAGKPMFISEWDAPWPNEWRAEVPLFLSAIGSLQGWSGFAIHTYRYGTNETEAVTDRIGRKIVIGNSYYRGIFDTYNDPAKVGLFYHAALILRRGDVKQAEKSIFVKINDQDFELLGRNGGVLDQEGIKPLVLTCEQYKVRMDFSQSNDKDKTVVSPDNYVADLKKGEILSDTGEIYRNWEKKIGWIDTEKTKAIYGFAGKAGTFTLKDLKVTVNNDFATVAISSLSEDGINSSDNMLLTAIGKADNANVKYNEEHTVQLEHGSGPVMIEVIEAEIEIKTCLKNLKVWSVDNEGFLTGMLKSTYENGVLKFKIGQEFESMYYLIQAQ